MTVTATAPKAAAKAKAPAKPRAPAKPKAPTKAALAKAAKEAAEAARPPRNPNNHTVVAAGVDGLRKVIAAAQAEGVANRYMTLHLSRRDLAILKRSPDVAVHEIRFADGEMKFLDIKVAAEPVDVSCLERPKAKVAAPAAEAEDTAEPEAVAS